MFVGNSDDIVNQVPTTLKSPKTGDIHPLTMPSTKMPTTTPIPTTRDVNATTKSPYNEVCYKVVGCFNDRPPFSLHQLPNSPEQVGTIFSLFRFNTTEEFLNYTNKESVSNSSYDYTLSTKFIVHGFAQDGKAGWVRKMKDEFFKMVGIVFASHSIILIQMLVYTLRRLSE